MTRGDMNRPISRPVVVKRLPERLNLEQARNFFRSVETLLDADRPQLVFDCSQTRHIDAAGVEMLLRCMTRSMKHDGDLKLAGLTHQVAAVLEMTRTDRLFEIYETPTDAVKSFSSFLPNALMPPVSSEPRRSTAVVSELPVPQTDGPGLAAA